MRTIVLATGNPHKIREIQEMLDDQFEIKGLTDIGCKTDLPETSPTLEGNALQKARYVHKKYGCNCFSDDTGLEIEALRGRPGVLSARYAGEQKSSEANMEKVLLELKTEANRGARFRTVIALILDTEEMLFEGIAEGEIISQKRGDSGFGYDPIFVPKGFDKTFSEMPLNEKNLISHRKKAFQMLSEYLMSLNYF